MDTLNPYGGNTSDIAAASIGEIDRDRVPGGQMDHP